MCKLGAENKFLLSTFLKHYKQCLQVLGLQKAFIALRWIRGDISTDIAHNPKHFGHFRICDSCTQLAAFDQSLKLFNLNIAVWVSVQ